MTPTAPSSPIQLLSPVAPSGKVAATTDAQATPDAGLGGFELLLGAMQQLQQELPSKEAGAETNTKDPTASTDDSGNALPQLGMLLPSTLPSPQIAGEKAAQPIDAVSGKGTSDKDTQDKGEKSDAIALGLFSFPLGFQPATPPANAANTTDNSAPVSASVAQLDSVGDGSANSGKNSAVGISLAQALSVTPSGDQSAATAITDSVVDVKSLTPNLPGAALPKAESDFDALIKHLDDPAAPQLPAALSSSDTPTLNSASRTYLNAANTTASIPVPVGNSGWSDAVADKVMWFSANNVSSAEIHLNPPDLGPLQVRVSTQQDQTSVVFTSQHATVREALDQALPRLREMMGSQGMHQLDVSVGGQSAQQQQQQQQFARNDSPERGAAFAGIFGDDTTVTSPTSVTTLNTARFARSGVDAYA